MWFYSALLTSVLVAAIAVLGKKLVLNVSASVLTWATLVLATPIIFVLTIKEGVPQVNSLFLLGVVGSVLFYTASQITGFQAMRRADLSAIWPLVSLGPIFTLLIAFMPPLSEKPSLVAVVGVFTTLVGVYISNVTKSKEGLLEPMKSLFRNKASMLMMFSVLTNSIVVVFDKLAIINTLPQNTTFTLLVENILVIVGMLPILFLRNKKFYKQITANAKLFLLLGLFNAISTVLAFAAVGGGNVGLVTAIFKAQILFVLLFGYVVLGDKPKMGTLIGSVVVIVGMALIKMGS